MIPARQAALRPVVIVRGAAAHVHETVDRVRAAQHLAARRGDPPAVGVRLGLRLESPGQARIAERIAPRQRHADAEVLALVVACLEQQHVERRILGQACTEHAAGRAAADHDVVDAPQRYSTV